MHQIASFSLVLTDWLTVWIIQGSRLSVLPTSQLWRSTARVLATWRHTAT